MEIMVSVLDMHRNHNLDYIMIIESSSADLETPVRLGLSSYELSSLLMYSFQGHKYLSVKNHTENLEDGILFFRKASKKKFFDVSSSFSF